jgi:pyridoxal phosphate enzyme (YggS family)
MDIEASLASVRQRIAEAAKRAGRDASEITLVAVTKTVPVERIIEAYRLGLRDFGENRVQEADDKLADPRLGRLPDVRWHLVGTLQRNKARRAAQLFDVIHSIDSLALAAALSRRCVQLGRTMPILLEVNVSSEATKHGFVPSTVIGATEHIAALPGLRLEGLMTMAPIVADPGQARPVFRQLHELRSELRRCLPTLPLAHLSMGMTDDFEVAVEEGATIVRIGRAIFGEPGVIQGGHP